MKRQYGLILFIPALLILLGCGVLGSSPEVIMIDGRLVVVNAGQHPGRNGALTEQEMALARIAWKYFENNYQPDTGLMNSVNYYPSTTMWDLASYMGGMMAAYELGIIDQTVFDSRVTKLLETLNAISFFNDELPNKAYHTKTAEKVNYRNEPGEIGYSTLDLGRLQIWLRVYKERYPQYGEAIDNFMLRWDFTNAARSDGTMYGAKRLDNGDILYVQEGRLGYEEYSAKGFQLWGFDMAKALQPEPYEVIPIYGVDVPYDARDPRKYKSHNYVVCEPYILDGIEFNWDEAEDRSLNDSRHTDSIVREFAKRIYTVQERRYQDTGILTARTEHQLDVDPYFVYDTIYTDGYIWNTITDDGDYHPEFAALALKGAFGLWVLWQTEYTDVLFETIAELYDPESGFYEGRYEKSGEFIKAFTSNNNGIILETLLYKAQGKLLRFGAPRETLWDQALKDPTIAPGKGRPNQR